MHSWPTLHTAWLHSPLWVWMVVCSSSAPSSKTSTAQFTIQIRTAWYTQKCCICINSTITASEKKRFISSSTPSRLLSLSPSISRLLSFLPTSPPPFVYDMPIVSIIFLSLKGPQQVFFASSRWGTADTEIDVPESCAQNRELAKSLIS